MNAWRTLLFALIAVILGAYIYLVERPRMQTEGSADLLVKFDLAEVRSFTLAYPGEQPITVERQDEGWKITEPLVAAADAATVDPLLEQIASAKAERRIAAGEAQDLAIYGLEGDGERARITLSLLDGTTLPDIIVGITTPVGFEAFARVEGVDEIIVTPLIFHTGIKKSFFELRDKRLFRFDESDVVAVEITSASRRIALERQDDAWNITAPIVDKADPEQVRTLVAAIANLQALAFFDGADGEADDTGLAESTVEIDLELDGGHTTGLLIGSRIDDAPVGYYLRRKSDGQVAKIPASIKTRFDVELDALRNKHLFDCDASEIARMSFSRIDGGSFVLVEGDEGDWSLEPPNDRGVRRAVATRRRNSLATLAGDTIVADGVSSEATLADYGLDAPVVEVELARRDGSSCGRAAGGIVDADTDEPSYYLKRRSDGMVMTAPQYLFSRLDALAEDFLQAE